MNTVMPKVKEINHPCHLLSLPSAKRFWCRHCMTVFEDAITRWHHSRSCRYGAVNNFMKRRELEVKALQNTAVLNPVEARIEQSIQMCDLATATPAGPSDEPQIMPGSESFNCLICHKKFASMEEMRVHVKYPCSSSTVITSCAPHPRHSVPVFIDALPTQTSQWQLTSQHHQNDVHPTATFVHTQSQQLSSYDIDIQSQEEVESQCYDTEATYTNSGSGTSDTITPTNIYVNEQGETVIEVENLDLNSEVGELSLAHLLTQLSQQGIVFDKTRSAELQGQHEVTVSVDASNTFYTTDETCQQTSAVSTIDEEEGQPTAEDAANTLAQLAGFRSFSRTAQVQAPDEIQLHSEAHSTQTYSYNSSANPNRQYITKADPHSNVKYEYEYSDSLSACDPSIVATQQIVLHQAMESASSDYENVNLEQSAARQYCNNSPNVAYATELNTLNQIEVDREAVASIESLKHNIVVDSDGTKSVLFHYPIQSSESGQLILTPAVTSARLIHGAQAEYVVSGEQKAGNMELFLTSASEGNTYITALNTDATCDDQENTQSTITVQEDAVESHVKTEGNELAARTVSPHGFEDPESRAIRFVSRTFSPEASHSADAELGLLGVSNSCIKQEAEGNGSSLSGVNSVKENISCEPSHDAPLDELAEHGNGMTVALTQILPTDAVSV